MRIPCYKGEGGGVMYARSKLAKELSVSEELIEEWSKELKENGYELHYWRIEEDEKELFEWLVLLNKYSMLNELSMKRSIDKFIQKRKENELENLKEKQMQVKSETKKEIHTVGELAKSFDLSKEVMVKVIEELISIDFLEFSRTHSTSLKKRYSEDEKEKILEYITLIEKQLENEKDEQKARLRAQLKFREKHLGISYIEIPEKEHYVFPDNEKVRFTGEMAHVINFTFQKKEEVLKRQRMEITVLAVFEIRKRDYRFPHVIFPEKTETVDVYYGFVPEIKDDSLVGFKVSKMVAAESYTSYISDFPQLSIKKFENNLLELALGKEMLRTVLEMVEIKERDDHV